MNEVLRECCLDLELGNMFFFKSEKDLYKLMEDFLEKFELRILTKKNTYKDVSYVTIEDIFMDGEGVIKFEYYEEFSIKEYNKKLTELKEVDKSTSGVMALEFLFQNLNLFNLFEGETLKCNEAKDIVDLFMNINFKELVVRDDFVNPLIEFIENDDLTKYIFIVER